jgi:two-component system CheB/CheR fusion protein
MTFGQESIDGPTSPAGRGGEQELEELLDYLRRRRGFDFTGYKRASLGRRVQQRMARSDVATISDYLALVHTDPAELRALEGALLINVTAFFRDPGAWQALSALVPALLARRADAPVRVWSAGCSSGEEPYTLAILLREALGRDTFERRVKIYATDVDDDALTTASRATYARAALGDVPPVLAAKYFTSAGERARVAGEIRRAVVFERHDLLRDAPLPRVDLLSCRNVLIYLDSATQERLLEGFRLALNPGGLLLLGRAEMLLTRSHLFTPVDLQQRIFSGEPRGGREQLETADERELRPGGELATASGLLEAARAGIAVVDRELRVQVWSEAMAWLSGVAAHDAIGRPIDDVAVAPGCARAIAEIATSLRVALGTDRYVVRTLDGPGRAGEKARYEVRLAPLGATEPGGGGVIVFVGEVD